MATFIYRVFTLSILFSLLESCSQLFEPNEKMIDTLLAEREVLDLLTRQEWYEHQYYDPYTMQLTPGGGYSSGSGNIMKFGVNGYFSERTNSLNPRIISQGRWRFIKSSAKVTAIFQRDVRYKRLIQGTFIGIDSLSAPQIFNNINIDTLTRGYPIVFVSNKEFFFIMPSNHGSVSSYYKAR